MSNLGGKGRPNGPRKRNGTGTIWYWTYRGQEVEVRWVGLSAAVLCYPGGSPFAIGRRGIELWLR